MNSTHSRAKLAFSIVSFLLVLTLLPDAASAARKLHLTPLETSTIHGGTINETSCGSADMMNADMYGTRSGVRLAYHVYKFVFRNLSPIPQTVILRVLPETQLRTSNSGGELQINRYAGPQRNVRENHDIRINLRPYDTSSTSVKFVATGDRSQIVPLDSEIICESTPPPPAQTCLVIDSTLVAEVEILEDRGAVSGSVSTVYHRCYGKVDVLRSTPVNKDLNGGRPF